MRQQRIPGLSRRRAARVRGPFGPGRRTSTSARSNPSRRRPQASSASQASAAPETASFGLATVLRSQVRVRGARAWFDYPSKSGVRVTQEVTDEAVARVLRSLLARRDPSPELLAYWDGRRWRDVRTTDINAHLAELAGTEMTAKDFRTWHATVIAAAALAEAPEATSKTARKRTVSGVMKEVAEFLGNTPALARSAYVDPRIVDAYEEGRTIERAAQRHYRTADARQAALERAVLKLLKE